MSEGRPPGRRDLILEAALRLFGEHGVEAVSTRQIAAAVGISQPSLYAHFATKHDLVAEVCARAFRQLAARLHAISSELRGRPRLEAAARAYIDFALEQPNAYRVAFMMEEPPRTPAADGPGLVIAAGLETFALHHAIVVEELGADRSDADIAIVSQSLWASLHGLASLLIARPSFPWADRERLIGHHVDAAIRAARGGTVQA